jgi:hypothetical protein
MRIIDVMFILSLIGFGFATNILAAVCLLVVIATAKDVL